MEPCYNKVLGTMKIALLYRVSHFIRVKKRRKSWDQQNYLVIRGFCYIRPFYNEVPLYPFIRYPITRRLFSASSEAQDWQNGLLYSGSWLSGKFATTFLLTRAGIYGKCRSKLHKVQKLAWDFSIMFKPKHVHWEIIWTNGKCVKLCRIRVTDVGQK